MNGWQAALHNPVLVGPVIGWCVAQILKVLINLAMTRKWNWERVVGGGGMPSSHSSTVGALATAACIKAKLDETSRDKWTETILKDYVGHTPIQVLVGLLLGIAIGYIVCRCV